MEEIGKRIQCQKAWRILDAERGCDRFLDGLTLVYYRFPNSSVQRSAGMDIRAEAFLEG